MTTSAAAITATAPCEHAHDHDHDHDHSMGGDFVRHHRITCTSWDLGTVQNGLHLRQQWTLRMQRHDSTGTPYSLTWIHDWNTGTGALDWDWAIFLLARDAQNGRLSWPDYRTENHLSGATLTELSAEREYWIRCVRTWHRVRDFLGAGAGLLVAFFDVVPHEH
ncbi:hypothetical protein SAMN05421837_11882 [Amycolatopsis pretoriensis]|uniref:Uncharacterized protein n=1 Tax=Amycolatopsis pretoriensis TaxID=218821 RepID=A0A1H5RKT8_9PSEU|nr:hypothetical protein [Amycolatopsis pretoriensis]SEF38131.1 hypothetical protein SAMN05421837_11882 [Amycolatopsis pretoriensis]